MNHTSKKRRSLATFLAGLLLGVATILAAATATAGTTACAICGKNLIKNPGAEAGLGIMAVDASGAVPGWTNVAGEFGAASYGFPNGWFSARSTGPTNRARTTSSGGRPERRRGAGNDRKADDQAARRRGRQTATLSGWLGNYSKNTAQVRAQFEDAAGKLLSAVRIGPDTTIAGTNMTARSRSAKVPAGAKQVTVVVTFAGGGFNYKLAGADALSLTLR